MPGQVTPFRVEVPEADIADLAQRLRRTRWPEPETVADWSQGVPLANDHDGHLEHVLTRDELLGNLMLYWLPRTGASAARLYWESISQVNRWITEVASDPINIPTGCSVFPGELQRPSRRWARRCFPDIRYWGEPPRGGHFAAFEQPELFVNEICSFFRLVR